jgi:hypothetical protein
MKTKYSAAASACGAALLAVLVIPAASACGVPTLTGGALVVQKLIANPENPMDGATPDMVSRAGFGLRERRLNRRNVENHRALDGQCES